MKAAALLLLLVALALLPCSPLGAEPVPEVWVLDVRGAITRGTADYLTSRLERAEGVEAVVIRLDTPGGLVEATLDIVRAFSAAEVPVIVYVGPEGSIAASAGALLLVGSHVAVMAPGTTTGAAMPVRLDPLTGTPDAADEKTVKFLAGYVRNLAEERGRPPDIAEAFVTENLTLGTDEALGLGIIDAVAQDLPSLLAAVDGQEVSLKGRTTVLETAGAKAVEKPPSAVERFNEAIGDPQVAYLLLIGGVMGLYLGALAPGTFVPETLGALSLLLGIYGLGLFSKSVVGLALLLLGVGLITAEIFTPTVGILGVGGVVSLALGAFLLPEEPLLPTAWYGSFRVTVLATATGLGIVALALVAGVIRSRRRRRAPSLGEGRVVKRLDPVGMIRYRGELWRARTTGAPIDEGRKVLVVAREGLTLLVREGGDDE